MQTPLLWSGETEQQANDSELVFLMEVAVEVVVMEGGEVATQTQGHQKASKGVIIHLSRGTIAHNPRWIKLERKRNILEHQEYYWLIYKVPRNAVNLLYHVNDS